MATTEELLATAEESEESTVDYFVIDNDLRTITVPSSKKILGVESDNEVNRLYFKMPATYEGTDLSEFKVRVNYRNANKEGDAYAVEDAAVDGDYITFSWVPGRNATAYKGNVTFIVCLKLVDSDTEEVTKEFNTTVATLTVLEGLETTEQIASENYDLIEQILLQVEACNTATESANSASDSANDATDKLNDIIDTLTAAEGAFETATELKAALDESTEEVAKETTAEEILNSINTNTTYLKELADSAGEAGSLNGFGMELNDDSAVVLTHEDSEEETSYAVLPTKTTVEELITILDAINASLKVIAEAADNPDSINGIVFEVNSSGQVVMSYTDSEDVVSSVILPTETTLSAINDTMESINTKLAVIAGETEE
ncbi:MAG: hypothetical protein LIO96_11165 [Lachnospiraceae bacterium]|nr:hypothetical protein [Lachnospiraceae bacterium]